MESSAGVRHERQEVSSTDSPRVEGSIPARGSFLFLLNLFALIQFWQICQNDLLYGKLDYFSYP